MKFSVGDPVYIKSNDEEGVIVEIVDANTFKVRAGTSSYHAFTDDLEHPYLRWFIQKNKQKKKNTVYIDQVYPEKPGSRKKVLPDGVYLVFFPVYKVEGFEEVIEKIKIFLYNETDKKYRFEYIVRGKDNLLFDLENELNSNSEFYIHDLQFADLAASPVFNYKFADLADEQLETESALPLKPKKLFEYLDKIKYDNHAFFSILLFEKIVAPPKQVFSTENIVMNPVLLPKSNHFDFSHALKKTKYEIDLHIEKLAVNHKNLTSGEKIQIQLKEFQRALDLAIITHQRSIVFIHGVGKGTLKSEIHKILLGLKQTKTIKEYVNSFDQRYGYGATEVYFH